jgi:hypothetical protein
MRRERRICRGRRYKPTSASITMKGAPHDPWELYTHSAWSTASLQASREPVVLQTLSRVGTVVQVVGGAGGGRGRAAASAGPRGAAAGQARAHAGGDGIRAHPARDDALPVRGAGREPRHAHDGHAPHAPRRAVQPHAGACEATTAEQRGELLDDELPTLWQRSARS